jgi:oxygen-independent coproporphyrinogen-3 oxidase
MHILPLSVFINAHETEKDKYLDALDKEMDIYIRNLGLDKLKLRVALVGGGTPTNLNPKQLKRFLKMFTDKCDLSSLKQFNFDVSPSNLVVQEGLEKLKIMKEFGVDRLTIGIQSLNENILRQMNRSHDKSIALKSIKKHFG